MRITDRLKAFINPQVTFRMGSNQYGVYKSQSSIEKVFSGWAFVCLHKRAKYVSNLNIYPAKLINDKLEPQKNWISELLLNPYPPANLTISEVIYQIQMSKDITGNAYIWTPKNGYKQPLQIYVLPPREVTIHLGDGLNEINYYEWRRGTDIINIDPSEVCHICTPSIVHTSNNSFIEGKSLLATAAQSAIDADYEMLNYITTFFENSAIPPLVAKNTSGIALTDSLWERFKLSVKAAMPAHVPNILLDSGIDIMPLVTGQADTLSRNLVKDSISTEIRKRIAAVFEIPDAMLTSDFNTRSDAGYILQWFHTDTIEGERVIIDTKLTQHFKQFEDCIITHDKYAYVDPAVVLAERTMLLQNKVITVNELRAELGYSPIEEIIDEPESPEEIQQETDENKEQVSMRANYGFEGGLIQTKSLVKTYYSGKDYNQFTEKMKTDLWNFRVKQDEPFEENIAKVVKKVFSDLGKEVLKNLKKNLTKGAKKEPVPINSDMTLFDVEKWKEILGTELSPVLTSNLIAGLRRAIDGFDYSGTMTDFSTQISKTVSELSISTIVTMDTLDDDLQRSLKAILKDNVFDTSDELFNALKKLVIDKFADYSDYNVRRVARTTQTFTSTKADLIVVKEMGLNYVWMSERDSRVRDSHRRMDGEPPDEEGLFHVGTDTMEHPAGGSRAEENVNCRCRLFGVKKGN